MGLRPDFKIVVNGSDRTEIFKQRRVSLSIKDETGFKTDELTLVVANQDRLLEPPRRGAEIEVSIGYEGRLVRYGDFVVDEIKKNYTNRTVTVSAKGFDTRSTMKTRKIRSLEVKTVAELANQVANDNNLDARVAPETKMMPIRDKIVQQDESDLNLLTRYCKQFECVFKISGKNLVVIPKGSGKSASGKAIPPYPLVYDDGIGVDVVYSGREEYGSVVADVESTEKGEIKEVRFGDKDPAYKITKKYQDTELALAACRAKFNDLRYAGTKMTVEVEGDPELFAERLIEAQGFDSEDDGRWLAVMVSHDISTNFYKTKCSLERL